MSTRRALWATSFVLALSVAGTGQAGAAPGDLDTTYGLGTGGSRLDFGVSEKGNAVAVQPDGRIIIAGTQSGSVNDSHFFVARVKSPEGTLDTSYGLGTGASKPDFGTLESASAVALQPDGKIVVAGTSVKVDGTTVHSDILVARLLNPEGTLDPSYGLGTGGSRPDFGRNEFGAAVALQPDGKIVVGGSSGPGLFPVDMFVTRFLNPEGTLDTSYGLGTGGSRPDFGPGESGAAVAVQHDGRILVAGTKLDGILPGSQGDFIVARLLNPQGTLDSSFGPNGGVTVDFGKDDDLTAMVEQPDGKILLAGSTNVNGTTDFAVARLLGNGLPDNTFGDGGKAIVDLGGIDRARAMVLQPNGKIVVVGERQEGSSHDVAAIRLQPGGTLDSTFGNAGKAIVDLGRNEAGNAVALDPDGKIVIGGTTSAPGATDDMLVVRLQGDPATTGGGPPGGGGTAIPTCAGRKATIVGTEKADKLTGTTRADVIVGLGGNDTIKGGGGNDLICAGTGNDRVDSGSGNDRIFGQSGKDSIVAGTGNDRVDAGSSNDRVAGQSGKDSLVGGSGDDHLDGGTSNDRLSGQSGKDTLLGGPGNDHLDGGTGDDRLSGQSGKDTLLGGPGRDRLNGGSGHDKLSGGPGRDTTKQ